MLEGLFGNGFANIGRIGRRAANDGGLEVALELNLPLDVIGKVRLPPLCEPPLRPGPPVNRP